MMGGHERTISTLPGFRRLHALDACAGDRGRVRWLADVPGVGPVNHEQQTTMSPPSISGGIVYVGTDMGHLAVLADPAVWPTPGLQCEKPDLTIQQCQAQGKEVVPRPARLADHDLRQGEILAEPALAQGRVYVATDWRPRPNAGTAMITRALWFLGLAVAWRPPGRDRRSGERRKSECRPALRRHGPPRPRARRARGRDLAAGVDRPRLYKAGPAAPRARPGSSRAQERLARDNCRWSPGASARGRPLDCRTGADDGSRDRR